MAQKHTITFDATGKIKVDATGYTGNACQETTERLLASLGGNQRNENLKPEFSQPSQTQSGQQAARRW